MTYGGSIRSKAHGGPRMIDSRMSIPPPTCGRSATCRCPRRTPGPRRAPGARGGPPEKDLRKVNVADLRKVGSVPVPTEGHRARGGRPGPAEDHRKMTCGRSSKAAEDPE